MNRLLVFSAAVLAFALSACGTSPEQLCNDAVAAMCNKMYTCYTGAELDAIKSQFGPTEADCTSKFKTQAACASKKDSSTACETGKTYDASAASACVSDFKALSCEALKGNMTPTSCDNVCK
ncbi:MAG: hypothetical protein AB1730_09010 [Myxococcota bacterium]|jgi:hypothetical protein